MCGKGGQLPLEAHTFDLLFCIHALYHFDDPGKFVTQAQQVFHPGGALAIIEDAPHA